LSFRRYIVFRRTIALICMALAVMLSGQAYISLMDQVEHAHHHAHFANPLAGGVICATATTCGHHHDDHVQQASHHHDDGQRGSHHHHDAQGPADHQHGDATILSLAAQSFVLSLCPITAERCSSAPVRFVSVTPLGPDHPPKPGLEIRV